jgi:hypothetical protein
MAGGADALIEFRTAYLRAVGLLWRKGAEDADVKSLLEPSKNALEALDTLFGCTVPWNMWVRLLLDADPEKRPQWRPRLSGGWVGGERAHRIIVYTPDRNCLPNEAAAADALGGYYNLAPSIFGKKPAGPEDEGFDIKLGSITTFEEFGGVFIRMLGLLWRAGEEAALAKVPTNLFGTDPEDEFARWLGYRWPWDIDLKFVRCITTPLPGVRYCMRWFEPAAPGKPLWQFAEVKDGAPGPWQNGLPPNELELSMPHNPVVEDDRSVRDIAIEPLALAAYNQSGERHPLTCCACC